MSMLAELVEVVIGVDTHKDSHTAAVVDARTGGVLARATVPADPDGYAELTVMAEQHSGLRAWAPYIQGRGALKRDLVACLRTGRALCKPRERSRNRPQGHVTAEVVLSERPAEAEDRAVPGHWEGDLIIGLSRSAIGTVVERTSRYTLLVHLPRLESYGNVPPVKNGPALGGYGAVAMKDALTTTMGTMPAELLRSLTWDRGKELSAHAQFKVDTGIAVYFADPHSPWQRGTNENTNGLLRQYFPKGTDLSRWNLEDLLAVQTAVNSRPRKVLDWKTPAEVLDEQLRLLHQAGVATTG
jgi:IS30 family transposase